MSAQNPVLSSTELKSKAAATSDNASAVGATTLVPPPPKTYRYGTLGGVIADFIPHYQYELSSRGGDASLEAIIHSFLSCFIFQEMRFWEAGYGNNPRLDQDVNLLRVTVLKDNSSLQLDYVDFFNGHYNDRSSEFFRAITKFGYSTYKRSGKNMGLIGNECLENLLEKFARILRDHGARLNLPDLGFPLPFQAEVKEGSENQLISSATDQANAVTKMVTIRSVMTEFAALCQTGKCAPYFSRDGKFQIQRILEHCLPYPLHFWKPSYSLTSNDIWLDRDIHAPIFRTPQAEKSRQKMAFLTYILNILVLWYEQGASNRFMPQNLYYLLKTLATILVRKGASLTSREGGFAPPFVYLTYKYKSDLSEENIKFFENTIIEFCMQPFRDLLRESITAEHLKQSWMMDGRKFTFLDYVWLERGNCHRFDHLNLIYQKIKRPEGTQIQIKDYLANPETVAIAGKILPALRKNKDILDKSAIANEFMRTNGDVTLDGGTLYLFSAFVEKEKEKEKDKDKKEATEEQTIETLVQMFKRDMQQSKEVEREKEKVRGPKTMNLVA